MWNIFMNFIFGHSCQKDENKKSNIQLLRVLPSCPRFCREFSFSPHRCRSRFRGCCHFAVYLSFSAPALINPITISNPKATDAASYARSELIRIQWYDRSHVMLMLLRLLLPMLRYDAIRWDVVKFKIDNHKSRVWNRLRNVFKQSELISYYSKSKYKY